MEAHPKVRQDAGRVALQRGPVVYCLEEADNGADLNDLLLPRDAGLAVAYDANILPRVPLITGTAWRRDLSEWDGQLYQRTGTSRIAAQITAVPYCYWANRSEGEMLVWLHQC